MRSEGCGPPGGWAAVTGDLAPLAWKVNQLTETPYLMPEHYAIVLSERTET